MENPGVIPHIHPRSCRHSSVIFLQYPAGHISNLYLRDLHLQVMGEKDAYMRVGATCKDGLLYTVQINDIGYGLSWVPLMGPSQGSLSWVPPMGLPLRGFTTY
jgi:hypothetical protein